MAKYKYLGKASGKGRLIKGTRMYKTRKGRKTYVKHKGKYHRL